MARLKNKGRGKRVKGRGKNSLIFILIALILLPSSLFPIFWFFSPWNGRDPVNVVVSSGENLWVLSVRPQDKQIVRISIPKTAIIEIPGRGKWQARALWEISRLEKDPSLVAAAGWNLLEVPIDFTLRLPQWKAWPGLKIKEIDLSNLNISRRVVDPGGAELVEINPDLLSPRVEEWFGLDSLRREGLTIAVRNGSSRPGAGALMSRQLEHVGLRVVSVTDGEGDNILTVKSNEIKKSLSVRKLSSWLKTKPAVAGFPDRADILIVVK